ncbi:hypothetical protein CEXT_356531 [Caerostris extrusa]|uniref:Ycf15 n=1 Tax=Caerostris extrusa TaxID=172846 RepID=A0AAV4XE23_CAEEX|nr:hypothetical protein CEXT_356531 [Caerostris extrusa]
MLQSSWARHNAHKISKSCLILLCPGSSDYRLDNQITHQRTCNKFGDSPLQVHGLCSASFVKFSPRSNNIDLKPFRTSCKRSKIWKTNNN